MTRKGQAAVEFLMTYGWAILAAVIAIGVLAYFGVFSPGKYVSGTAIVNAPFYVNAWNAQVTTVNTDGEVNLELRNNGGEDYQVTSVIVENCGTLTIAAPGTTISPSLAVPFEIVCDPLTPIVVGDTIKGDITISYNKVNSGIALTSTGTIAEKVTQGA